MSKKYCYEVVETITEVRKAYVLIEADNTDEAEEILDEALDNGEIELEWEDEFSETEYEIDKNYSNEDDTFDETKIVSERLQKL